jgi:hypothetical protein
MCHFTALFNMNILEYMLKKSWNGTYKKVNMHRVASKPQHSFVRSWPGKRGRFTAQPRGPKTVLLRMRHHKKKYNIRPLVLSGRAVAFTHDLISRPGFTPITSTADILTSEPIPKLVYHSPLSKKLDLNLVCECLQISSNTYIDSYVTCHEFTWKHGLRRANNLWSCIEDGIAYILYISNDRIKLTDDHDWWVYKSFVGDDYFCLKYTVPHFAGWY